MDLPGDAGALLFAHLQVVRREVPELLLREAQLLVGEAQLGHVLVGAEHPHGVTRCVTRHFPAAVQDSHGTVRPTGAEVEEKRLAVGGRAIDDVPHVAAVVDVDQIERPLVTGPHGARLDPEDAAQLVGPGDRAGAEIPFPAPHPRDLLREQQLALPGAQRLIGLLAVGHVLEDAQDAGVPSEVGGDERHDHVPRPAIPVANDELELRDDAGAAQPVDEVLPLSRSDQSQLHRRAPDNLLALVSGESEKRRVDVEETPVRQPRDTEGSRVGMECLGESLLRFAQRLLSLAPLDRDPGQIGRAGDELMLRGRWGAGLAVIHRERAQHLAGRGDDRRRPAGAQPVRSGERAIILPQGVRLHVTHDDRLTPEGGGAARAGVGPDLEAVHGLVVGGGQAGRRPVTQPPALAVQQQNRAQHARRGALDQGNDGVEDFGERGAASDTFEDVRLAPQRGAGPLVGEHLRARDRGGGFGHRGQR